MLASVSNASLYHNANAPSRQKAMTGKQISQAAVEPEWGRLADVAKILNVAPSTATKFLNKQRAAGNIGELHRRFHLPTIRYLAIQASMEADS